MVWRVYLLDAQANIPQAECANVAHTEPQLSWDQWHQCFWHLSITGLRQLADQELVTGLNVDQSSVPTINCQACIQSKLSHHPFLAESDCQADKPGDMTHSDLWGPARVEGINKAKYYISFTNDFTCCTTVKFLTHKLDAFQKIKEHITFIKTHFDHIPKVIQVDNSREFIHKDVAKILTRQNWTPGHSTIFTTTEKHSWQWNLGGTMGSSSILSWQGCCRSFAL